MPGQPLQLFGSFGVNLTAEGIAAQLATLNPQQPLAVEINSDGGSVQEGVAVFNQLARWPGGVDVEIVGWALSVASMVAMVGRTVRMHASSLLMIHAPWVGITGNAAELRAQADLLDLVTTTMRAAYGRTKQRPAVIDQWLAGPDVWITADEAVSLGLADEIVQTPGAPDYANASASRFSPPPAVLLKARTMPAPQGSASPASAPSTSTATDPAAIRAEAIRAESQRRADIRSAFDPFIKRGEPGMQALLRVCEDDPACTPAAADLRILAQLGRGAEPAGRFVSTEDGTAADFMEAARDALLMRAGIRVDKPHPQARELRHMSIVTMASTLLSRRGHASASQAPDRIISAALSTSDFPALLANVADKSLRTGYADTPTTFTAWTGEREVTDFKPATLAMMSEAPDLLEVPELAEYQNGKLSDSASTFQVKTFGRILSVSRQALVNDDLGAFSDIPKALGQAARRLEADSVYALLSGNPALGDGVALFHASRGNLAATGSAPSIASLDAARQAMRKQKGIAGLSFIDPMPRYIVCPLELELIFEILIADLNNPTKGTAFGPEWMKNLTVFADPRLSAVDPKAWYLAADPAQIDGIVRVYLAGEARPFLESFDETKRIDASSWKARLDFATGVIDWRGLYKNPGA